MRVLRVIASMNPSFGGPSQGIRNSIPEQLKEGITNEVLTLDNADEDFIRSAEFAVHAIGKSNGPWCYHPGMIDWLNQNLSRFDFVIIHGLWLYPGYAVYKAVASLKKKNPDSAPIVFVMPHGMLDPYFVHAAGRKLKALRNLLYWKFIESKIIHAADGILFTCEEEMLLARKAYTPYKPLREINAGYGIASPPLFTVEMKEAFAQRLPFKTAEPYWLFLSRIHEKKGVDLLIKAYIKLAAETNVPLPNLVIAGPGLESPYGKSLQEELQKQEAKENKIFFVGMLQKEAKWGAFYGAEAFVLPSHQENFGISVAEALACSLPVLISDKVNIYREIKGSQAGLVDADTLDGTFNLLKRWNSLRPEEKSSMKNNAVQLYQTKFNAASVAQNWKKTITEIYSYNA